MSSCNSFQLNMHLLAFFWKPFLCIKRILPRSKFGWNSLVHEFSPWLVQGTNHSPKFAWYRVSTDSFDRRIWGKMSYYKICTIRACVLKFQDHLVYLLQILLFQIKPILAQSYPQIVFLTKDFDFIQEFLITDLMIKVKNTFKSHIWTVRVLSTSLIFFLSISLRSRCCYSL